MKRQESRSNEIGASTPLQKVRSAKYVDLFAGCGGLSLGLRMAGYANILSVEKSPMAAETYYHNLVQSLNDPSEWSGYCKLDILEQAKSGLIVGELSTVLSTASVRKYLDKESVDVIAGGPPCQGFSLAGRRNPRDARNKLVWEFLEMVDQLAPKAVIIENVPGMGFSFTSDATDSVFHRLRKALGASGRYGYAVQGVMLNAAHYGAPQHRQRLMLIAIRADIAKDKGVEVSADVLRSSFLDELSIRNTAMYLLPQPTHNSSSAVSTHEALCDLGCKRLHFENSTYSRYLGRAPTGLLSPNKVVQNHVFRNHSQRVSTRFRLYQILSQYGISRQIINAAFKPREIKLPSIVWPLKSPDGKLIIRNREALIAICQAYATKKHSQRVVNWGKPAPTVVSNADDLIHPIEVRTFTVRELARLQSFPDWFEFRSKETTGGLKRRVEVPQYTQVGNAVPPLLGKAIGEMLLKFI